MEENFLYERKINFARITRGSSCTIFIIFFEISLFSIESIFSKIKRSRKYRDSFSFWKFQFN